MGRIIGVSGNVLLMGCAIALARATGDGGEGMAMTPDSDLLAVEAVAALSLEPSEARLNQRGFFEAGLDPGEEDGLIGRGTREGCLAIEPSEDVAQWAEQEARPSIRPVNDGYRVTDKYHVDGSAQDSTDSH